MKLITRDTDYALRAVCFIAKYEGKIIPVSKLAGELNVPQPFLRKILQVLSKKNVLKSVKGQGGGFLLNRRPKDIFLTDIMRIFQGKLNLNECSLKKLLCPEQKICPLRKKISKIEQYVLRELKAISIASLLE